MPSPEYDIERGRSIAGIVDSRSGFQVHPAHCTHVDVGSASVAEAVRLGLHASYLNMSIAVTYTDDRPSPACAPLPGPAPPADVVARTAAILAAFQGARVTSTMLATPADPAVLVHPDEETLPSHAILRLVRLRASLVRTHGEFARRRIFAHPPSPELICAISSEHFGGSVSVAVAVRFDLI